MTADVDIRAKRRQVELQQKGQEVDLQEIKENLIARDRKDSSRVESPLLKVTDAIEIDTTSLSFEQQVGKIIAHAQKVIFN